MPEEFKAEGAQRGGWEDNPLYKSLLASNNQRVRLYLKDGQKPIGYLNHVGFDTKGEPFIILDMGDKLIAKQYNLNFDNISNVQLAEYPEF